MSEQRQHPTVNVGWRESKSLPKNARPEEGGIETTDRFPLGRQHGTLQSRHVDNCGTQYYTQANRVSCMTSRAKARLEGVAAFALWLKQRRREAMYVG